MHMPYVYFLLKHVVAHQLLDVTTSWLFASVLDLRTRRERKGLTSHSYEEILDLGKTKNQDEKHFDLETLMSIQPLIQFIKSEYRMVPNKFIIVLN